MTAVARQFRCSAGIAAVLAAIFACARGEAIASGMGAFSSFSHGGEPPFRTSDESGAELFLVFGLPTLCGPTRAGGGGIKPSTAPQPLIS